MTLEQGTPTAFSSLAIIWESAGCAMCSLAAARVIWPSSATTVK